MEIGEKFKDLQSYNKNMSKGIEDKLFFLKHLPQDHGCIYVDFGCADGALIESLRHILPNNQFVGYDASEEMIDLARKKVNDRGSNVMFTDSWQEVENKLKGSSSMKKVLILSSVIHEVYSYAQDQTVIDLFWDRVLKTGFDYICVRDMMIPSDTVYTPANKEWTKNIDRFYSCFMSSTRLNEFKKNWGELTNKRTVLHFLLKYRWQINWNREVKENYFPIDIETFLGRFWGYYNLNHFERFIVPFIKDKIEEDFYIKLGDDDSTHIKAVFSKRTDK